MPGVRLILNADDFGLTRGINRAVAEMHEAGALTSATLMATGSAFEDAAEIARTHPRLGIGCHIVLTDGTPACRPEEIPSLLGPNGKSFRPSLYAFVAAVLLGRVRQEDIEREAQAQVRRLQRAGIHVTHLDTHKHTHIFPQVARPLLAVAERAGVAAVRNPFEPAWAADIGRSGTVRRVQLRLAAKLRQRFEALPQLRSGAVITTDGTLGVSATGELDAVCLQQVLTRIPPGSWELVCHPGYNDSDLAAVRTRLRESRDVERLALLGAFALNTGNTQPAPAELIQRIHFGELSAGA